MRGFSFTLPYTLWVTPEFFFAKWKTLWRYTIVVSFTIITFVAAKLTFQSLAYLISISACYEIGQHRDKKYIYIFKKNVIFFYSARFINVWGGKKSILSSIIWISNPLGAFKDIKISAQSVGRTHHKKLFWSY